MPAKTVFEILGDGVGDDGPCGWKAAAGDNAFDLRQLGHELLPSLVLVGFRHLASDENGGG